GILPRGRRKRRMRAYLSRGIREPLAMDVRSLRNPGNAHQQHAKQRSDTQPERPRSTAELALVHPSHAISSMTRFPCKRTQTVTKSRIKSRYADTFPSLLQRARYCRNNLK